MVKFPTDHGVGHLKGSQTVARQYYSARLQYKNPFEPLSTELDSRDEVSEERSKLSSELLKVPLSKEIPTQMTWISSNLDEVMWEKIIVFLQENFNIFTWTTNNMLKID